VGIDLRLSFSSGIKEKPVFEMKSVGKEGEGSGKKIQESNCEIGATTLSGDHCSKGGES